MDSLDAHKGRRMRCDLQDYTNQNYIGAKLDERVFDLLNDGLHGEFVHGGGLDAPYFMPAGSMIGNPGGWYDRSTVERGVSLAEKLEQEACVERLVVEQDSCSTESG